MTPITRSLWLLLWAMSSAGLARAQAVEPSWRALRIETPPTLDGRLDDDAWQRAEAIEDFTQRDPDQGAPGTERTSVRIVFDRTALYVGAFLADRRPDRILASELRRDSDFDSDDRFSVIIDSFHDHRNAFVFRVNPNGARFDGIVRNESDPDRDWDEQWYAASTIGPDGWRLELQIPFKALRFAPGRTHVWGIDLERVIRRKNEALYWANWSRDFDFEQVSQAGILTGLEEIQQGQRFRLRPYVVAGAESLSAPAAVEGARAVRDIGIDDLKIGLTSNLTADLAINPDFAQAEADQRQVNLTRFSLFFPEKRQFFIEGAGALRMRPEGEFDDESLELFHSRRIGLSDSGEPTTLIAGAKLTGKIAGTDVGMLGARTGASGAMPGETFGVVRFRRDLLNRSSVGAIATVRDGAATAQSTLGVDAQFVVQRHLTLSALAATTADRIGPRQWARSVSASWDSDFFSASAAHLAVDDDFEPAVGYVRRRDRQFQASLSIDPRPSAGPVRQFGFSPGIVTHHDPAGVLLTRELELEFESDFQSGDAIEVAVSRTSEYLPEPFEITDSIVVPVRRYDWSGVEIDIRTFDGRPISGSVSAELGGFYSGSRRSFELSPTFRAGRHLAILPSYEWNGVSLAEGAFRTHLVGARIEASFTRNLLASGFLQYDSEGRLASTQIRLDYTLRNIDHFYVVYNETRVGAGAIPGRVNRALLAKLTYSLYR